MKYLCLIYHEARNLESLSERELETLVGECGSWCEQLAQGGRHVYSAGLQGPRAAMTLRHRNGDLSVTDGPFAETKEFLGGFTILEARDLNEAIQLAAQMPAVRVGSIEVRPVFDPDAPLTDPLDCKIAGAIRRQAHP
jgi:hypothetical protein